MTLPRKLVIVTWEDNFDIGGENVFRSADDIEADNPSFLIQSVGWLVCDGPVVVRIATDIDRDGDLRRVYTIRRENIRDIQVVE